MKRTLLAMAVAAALPAATLATLPVAAQAQTNVTLSGFLKTGIANTRYSDTKGFQPKGNATSMDDGASRFVISGSEDLGSGLKAIFQLDNRLTPEDGAMNALAGGNSFVGLGGNFGTVRLGNLDQYYMLGMDRFPAGATALQSWNTGIMSFVATQGAATRAIARGTRTPNMIRYDLPASVGFTGGFGYSTNANIAGSAPLVDGNIGTDNGDAWTVDIGWKGGPISVGAAYWNADAQRPKGTTKSSENAGRLFGVYDFGMFTVGLAYDRSEVKAAGVKSHRDAWSIPLTAKLGPGLAKATYSQANDMKGKGGWSDSGAKLFSLGYDYPLSKRTVLGASFSLLKNDKAANYALFTQSSPLGQHQPFVAGTDVRQFYLGMIHLF